VRKLTKNAFTIVSFGVLGVSYAIGASAQTSSGFIASGSAAPSSSAGGSQSAAPTGSASASASASATTSASATPKPSNTASNPAPSASATKTAKTSTTPSAPAAGGTVSKAGAAINYRYGTIQVEVVKTGTSITAINMIQAGATGGRQQAFPYLVQEAIAAQSASVGNISNATFTTQAFSQALASALGKF